MLGSRIMTVTSFHADNASLKLGFGFRKWEIVAFVLRLVLIILIDSEGFWREKVALEVVKKLMKNILFGV